MAMAFTSQAQNGKPTKEETIQFINSYYEKTFSFQCMEQSSLYMHQKEMSLKNFNLVFDGNILKISWQENYKLKSFSKERLKSTDEESTYKTNLIIDFSKVQLIEQAFTNGTYLECEKDFIILYARFRGITGHKFSKENDGKSTEDNLVDIPINIYKRDNTSDQEAVNKKIIQAFNHLRKLCGAPEPISFD
jgi:hypothetical protein